MTALTACAAALVAALSVAAQSARDKSPRRAALLGAGVGAVLVLLGIVAAVHGVLSGVPGDAVFLSAIGALSVWAGVTVARIHLAGLAPRG